MKRQWWKEAVVYQIYPRSFYDSNGDGIGDLRGIITKLDYLKELGIDLIWLGPVYKSPNDDNGYDISDYCDIMDEFGTLADWEELLVEIHRRGMKLIMDLVVNHTSDEHPWFMESRSSADNPKRDYYIWRPGKDDGEPNNWRSYFTASAWEYDSHTGEYYLHLFSKKQPDLNWRNPRVKEEIFQMMRWWLDKGIDGFRMDVVNLLAKPEGLPDSAKQTAGSPYVFDEDLYANQAGIHQLLQEMNQRVLSGYDLMTVGETVNVTPEEALLYVGEDRRELKMLFQFELMGIDSGPGGKWDHQSWEVGDFKRIFNKWQRKFDAKGWNSLFLNNHDQPRMVSRFGDDGAYREQSAKMLATLLHTAQGTPYIYQGEEIGMTNVRFSAIDEYRDIETLNFYQENVIDRKLPLQTILDLIYCKSRDNARTPMQWDSIDNAGFTTGEPWIKVNPNFTTINVKEAKSAPQSIWYYYQKLIRMRKENPVIVYGEYQPILEEDPHIVAYVRILASSRLLVILNFTAEWPIFNMPGEIVFAQSELLIANYPVTNDQRLTGLRLNPYEARVYRLM